MTKEDLRIGQIVKTWYVNNDWEGWFKGAIIDFIEYDMVTILCPSTAIDVKIDKIELCDQNEVIEFVNNIEF